MAFYIGDTMILISRIGSDPINIWCPTLDYPRLVSYDNSQILESNDLYLTTEVVGNSFGGE